MLSDEPSPASSSGSAFITTVDGGAMSSDIPSVSTTVASTEASVVLVHDDAEQRHAETAQTWHPAVIACRSRSRATTALDRIEESPNTAAKGTSRSPTVTIDSCRTSCRHVGNRNSIPVKTQYAVNNVIEPADTARRRRMRTSNNGAAEGSPAKAANAAMVGARSSGG